MGKITDIVEEYIQGVTFGLSNVFGITGKGGVIHDDDTDPVATLDEDGIIFSERDIRLPWEAVVGTNWNDDDEVVEITHVGGLVIKIPYGRYDIDGDADSVIETAEEKMATSGNPIEVYFHNVLENDGDIDEIEEATEDLRLAKDVYEKINGSDVIILEEYKGLFGVYIFFSELQKLKYNDDEDICFKADIWIREHSDLLLEMLKLANFWGDQIGDDYSEKALSLASQLLSTVRYWMIYDFFSSDDDEAEYDAAGYALARTAFSDSDLEDEDKWLKWFDADFSSPENAKARKVIVCSDVPCALQEVGNVLDQIAIVDAKHLEKLIDLQNEDDPLETVQGQRCFAQKKRKDVPLVKAKQAAEEYKRNRELRRLSFEQGHPKNGCVYVQHPLEVNTYIEIEQFHASMLERKYNELIRILVSLGARNVKCRVENCETKDEKIRIKQQGVVGVGCVAGSAEFNGSSENESSKVASLSKKLNTELELNPNEKPHLPEDLIYYPFEEGWKQVVKNVLSGKLIKANIDLAYSTDYAITGRFVKNLGGKIESLLPGYQFSVNGSYASEIESDLKKLESIVWHYEVDFEKPEGCYEENSKVKEKSCKAEEQTRIAGDTNNKAEVLFLKRARRYAKSEGQISADQRADLESFAHKYGIDDFRMEELIEEAFE